jgi:hypothetical protein
LVAGLICAGWRSALALVDIDPHALGIARRLVEKMMAATKAPIKLQESTERREVLLNATLSTEAGLWKLVQLLRGFQALKGWHVQFNVVDSKTLLAAQQNPDEYKDLVVRVAGYSAVFVTLDKATQDDIIQRSVHEL